jgi:SOUL heme-binding protein
MIATHSLHRMTARKLAFYSSLALVPLGVSLAVSKRSRLAGGVAGGLTALVLGVLRWQLQRWFTDEPMYRVERRIGKLEIRRYAPHVEAYTQVHDTDYDAALQQGFRRLADYIFGDNFRGEQLAIATPLSTASPHCADSETLDMTAPVISAPAAHGYRLAFVMPAGRALATLPTPNHAGVELGEIPERRVAVIRFTGRYSGARVAAHQRELLELVHDAGLDTVGTPMFAGFDSPATLPWLRRNEVWIALADRRVSVPVRNPIAN